MPAKAPGLTLSTKSRAISNRPLLACRVCRALHARGIPIAASRAGEDLGTPCSAGSRRVAISRARRLRKALPRGSRVRTARKACDKASVLWKTGVRAQGHRSAPNMGCPPSQRLIARRNARLCAGSAGWQPCVASEL